jgi:hypothetical protein
MSNKKKAELYTRYPLLNILNYNGTTILHYSLGGFGIMFSYDFTWAAYVFGSLYLAFAFWQMYLFMPLKVCPNCVYYRLEGSICISGLNVLSRKIAREGDIKDFANRSKGLLCPNNLYLAALIIPIIAIIPALALSFSFGLLATFLVVLALLIYRFFVVFSRVACIHCRAKNICPNARSMNLSDT